MAAISYHNHNYTDPNEGDDPQPDFTTSRIEIEHLHSHNSNDHSSNRTTSVAFLTHGENRKCLALVVLSFLSVALFVSVLVLAARPRAVNVEVHTRTVDRPICREHFCERTATDLSKIMNVSADPCVDFYNYACGNWRNVYPLNGALWTSPYSLLQSSIYNTLSSILKNVKSATNPTEIKDSHENAAFIYKSCVENINDDSIQKLKDIIKGELEDWPLLSPPVPLKDTLITIMNLNTKVLLQYSLKIIFDFNVLPNPFKPNSHVFAITKNKLFSKKLINPDPTEMNYAAEGDNYAQIVRDMICVVESTCDTLANLDKDVSDLVAFERNMMFLTTPLGQRPALLRTMNVKLETLDKDASLDFGSGAVLKWTEALQKILNPFQIPKDYEIFAEVDTVKSVIELMKSSDIRVVKNWFVWKVLEQLGPRFSKKFRDNLRIKMSPEENCAFEVNSLMPYATTDLYDTYYWRNGRGKKEAALQVIDDLKAVIAGAFDRTQWLDVKAKERLVKKVQSIEPRVAFPDWIKDRTKLNQYYELSWTISTTIPTYLDVTTKILTLNWPREVKKLSEKFDRQTYWINPNLLNVNAWYHPLDNTITFPISYLDYPFFGDVSLPKSVVHGTFASTVGHEIFHGFDPMGILFDHDGQLVQELFSDEVVNTYQSKIQCIMEKYNSTTGKGALTISEDFADNSAMGIFIEGYKNSSIFHDDFLPSQDISKLQLLYVAFASPFCSEESEQYQALTANDVHSGNKYRVLITIQNDRNFGDIFKCKSGSTMNPVNKCSAFERN